MHRQTRPLAVLLLAALAAVLSRTAFVSLCKRPATGRRLRHAAGDSPQVRMLATATELETEQVAPTKDDGGLMVGQRYIATNRFQVRDGAEAQFEQRWATRKSSLMTLAGFRWFGLMRRVPAPGEASMDYQDDYNYISFTVWETKKNFNSWRKGPAFKEAHGGGSIFDFFGMIINGFMTSKGPPRPAFWRGVSVLKSGEAKDRLISGPGGRPDADGSSTLKPEVSAMMLRFQVPQGAEQSFEEAWMAERAGAFDKLQSEKGFRFGTLLRRDKEADDKVTYMAVSIWDDSSVLESWRTSAGGSLLQKEVDGIVPTPYFYEGTLVLESEAGA